MTNYVCTWWERVGQTDWVDLPSGKARGRTTIFRNIETGEQRLAGELPIGALYSIERAPDAPPNGWPPTGADGLSIACVCIGNSGPDSRHHWYIDYRASNCTRPDDKDHRCWVRKGTFGKKLTVGKDGNTCSAGAGSFFMDDMKWHGFLRNGVLVQG
jgi:hypothetical protein